MQPAIPLQADSQPKIAETAQPATVWPVATAAVSDRTTTTTTTTTKGPGVRVAGVAPTASSACDAAVRDGEAVGRTEGRAELFAEAVGGPAVEEQTTSAIQAAKAPAAGQTGHPPGCIPASLGLGEVPARHRGVVSPAEARVAPEIAFTSPHQRDDAIPTQAMAGTYASTRAVPETTTTVISPGGSSSSPRSYHGHPHHQLYSSSYFPRPSSMRRRSRSADTPPAVYTIQAPAQALPVQTTVPMQASGTTTGGYSGVYGGSGTGYGHGHEDQANVPIPSATYRSYQRYPYNYPSGTTGAGTTLASASGGFLDRFFGPRPSLSSVGLADGAPGVAVAPAPITNQYSRPQIYEQVMPQDGMQPTVIAIPSSRRRRRRLSC